MMVKEGSDSNELELVKGKVRPKKRFKSLKKALNATTGTKTFSSLKEALDSVKRTMEEK